MRPVKIVADSACDLPPDLLEQWDIRIVPLNVMLGSEDLTSLWNDPEAFWTAVEQRGLRPQTAAPSPEHLTQAARPLVDAGFDVVALSLTSRISAVYQSFSVAAREFSGHVVVFDSRSLSLGEGIQVLEAARLAAQGMGRDELLASLREFRARVHLTAVLNTLDWAERGGRIAYLMPLIRRATRLFNVHVLLHVIDGYVRLAGVQRTYRGALNVLKQRTLKLAPVSHLLVPHTRRSALARRLADELAPALQVPPERLLVHEAGAVLGSHVGPGALGTVVVTAR